MKRMFITKINGWIIIQVEGFDEWKYLYYTEKEAISKYRKMHNLEHIHLTKVVL